VTELEQAKAIVERIAPGKNPEFACMLVAAAIAGMRGLTMRNIRIGALFWPDKFRHENGDAYLSMRGGWGCEGYSEHDQRLFLADESVDEDGTFSGHTWLEPEPESVVDLMHDNEDSMREIYGPDFRIVGRYIPRTKLERAVKKFWRKEMQAAIRAGKEAR
jgi:hypothetical protein